MYANDMAKKHMRDVEAPPESLKFRHNDDHEDDHASNAI